MGEDNNKEYNFLKEETKKVPTNKKRFVKKLGAVILLAAVFGVISGFLCGTIKNAVENQQSQPSVPPSEDVGEETTTVPEQIVVQEKIEPTLDGYETLQTELYSIGSRAARSVVAISGVTNEKDWFEDDFQRNVSGSGVILELTETEVFILTETDRLENADDIEVEFFGGEKASASLKSYDKVTGLAVLAVEQDSIDEAVRTAILPLEMADIAITTPGAFVIGIGSPQEEAYSVVVGNITAAGKKISYEDKNYRIFTTSIAAYPNSRGVLLDSEGKMIGLICKSSSKEALRAINIADVSGLITKLKAGQRPAYLGVGISEVTVNVSETYGLPDGIFVKEVDMDSPAGAAGIQVGDVIVEIDGKEMLTEMQFEEFMISAEPEQKITITVLRSGNDDKYQEVDCKAVLGVAE